MVVNFLVAIALPNLARPLAVLVGFLFLPQLSDENNSLTLGGETPPLLLPSFPPYFQASPP